MKLIKYILSFIFIACSIQAENVPLRRNNGSIPIKPMKMIEPNQQFILVTDDVIIDEKDTLLLIYSSSVLAIRTGQAKMNFENCKFTRHSLASTDSAHCVYRDLIKWKKSSTVITFGKFTSKLIEYFSKLSKEQQDQVSIDELIIIDGNHSEHTRSSLKSTMFKKVINIFCSQNADSSSLRPKLEESNLIDVQVDFMRHSTTSPLSAFYKRIKGNEFKNSHALKKYPVSPFVKIIAEKLRIAQISNPLTNNYRLLIDLTKSSKDSLIYELNLIDSAGTSILKSSTFFGGKNKSNYHLELRHG